jgi:hypothetical protein
MSENLRRKKTKRYILNISFKELIKNTSKMERLCDPSFSKEKNIFVNVKHP